jgi:hypothetical protein
VPVRKVRALAAVTAIAGLALAGCSKPAPELTFYGDGHSLQLDSTLSCTIVQCANSVARYVNNTGEMTVRPGYPVQISVPRALAESYWQVEWRIRDAKYLTAVCSKIFTSSDQMYNFTVPAVPASMGKLVMINVYQGGVLLGQDSLGGLQYYNQNVWTVLTQPTESLPKNGENLCVNGG